MKIKFYLLFFSGFLLLASCKRNSDKPLWNVDLLTPLVQASLTLSNIVRDTSVVKTNPDNSITIVSRQRLASITLDSLVTLNTTPFVKTVTLDSLVLETRTDTTRITIGDIANRLIATGDSDNILLANLLVAAAVSGTPVDLSGIPALTFANFDVDISGFFQQADVAAGTLKVEVVNKLPVDIQSLDFQFSNKINSDIIISHTFTNIPALGGSSVVTQDLAGKTVEGVLVGDISPLQIAGGVTVLNLNQAIEVIMTISGVRVNSATAVFPAQDIVQNEDESTLTGMGDVELTYAEIDSGYIKVEVISTAQDNVYFTYEIPGAVNQSGNTFKVLSVVPAAAPGVPVDTFFYYNMAGYKMDLTGKNSNLVNTFYNTLTGRIEYTGRLVYFSLADYMTVKVTAEGLKPSYAKGYLGQNTVDIGPDFVNIDIFKGIESGTLNFENVDMKLVVENGFGLDGSVLINNITAENSRTGNIQTLTGPNVGSNIAITKATDNPFVSANTTLDMSTSSNATSLINILPDKVGYNVQVVTNPGGNSGAYTDFAYKSASLNAYLDIEMPLSVIASKLVLRDTAEFNAAAIQKRNVNSGTFKVYVKNGFPLNASLKMYFLNSSSIITDSVKSLPGAIMAAPVDGSYRVTEKRSSEVIFDVDQETMNNLYNSSKVIFKIEFTTEPSATFMKIYSDYSIDFKLVGDMDYSVYKK